MKSLHYPRLLIVTSNTFNRFTGGGISLLSLFQGWPREQMANVYFEARTPDTSSCDRFYRVTGQERNRLHVKLSINLAKWIRQFNPQILYTTLGDLRLMRLVRQILQENPVGLVVDMKDDWPSSLYRGGLASFFYRHMMKRELMALLHSAKRRYCISESMRLAYEARYKLPFQTFKIPIETSAWTQHSRSQWRQPERFRLVYMGTVDAQAQLESLLDIARAVSGLRQEGERLQLELYVPESYVSLLEDSVKDFSGVILRAAPENTKAPLLLSGADLLVIPANFDVASLRYTRYSLPSKCAAYMISGTPILVYGPEQMPVVRYAKEEGWGMVVEEQDQVILQKAILHAMQDEKARESYAKRAREVAYKNHDAASIRQEFHEELCLAAGSLMEQSK